MTNLKDLIIGMILSFIAQVATFFQLQGPLKFALLSKYYWLVVLAGIPLSMLFMASTKFMVGAFGGALWPSRLIGFSMGAIVFTWLSVCLFKEPLAVKTIISLILAIGILLIQIFWK
jgi:hypothetical protein